MTPVPAPAPWLRLVRWVVVALVALSMLAVVASVVLAPAYVRDQGASFALSEIWTSARIAMAERQIGWPLGTVAGLEFARFVTLYVSTLVPGLLILRRRSYDWFGLYVVFTFAVVPALVALQPLAGRLPALEPLTSLAGAAAWQLYFILFYVFPNGRFVPGWTRWLILAWIGMNFIPGIGEPTEAAGLLARLPWLALLPFVLVSLAIGSQVYRYFWRASVVERQQTKWVVLVLAGLIGFIALLDSSPEAPLPGREGAALIAELGRLWVTLVGFAAVPLVMVIAILRYRLWDIDVLIRRTLVYSVLTGLLAVVYFGSVVILQGLLRGLTGAESPLVIVLSTLLIAALFIPLRARVQRAIDRRFYRRKYDAARTLAAFGAQARDETNLSTLSQRLQLAVQETMEPAHVSLWLKDNHPA